MRCRPSPSLRGSFSPTRTALRSGAGTLADLDRQDPVRLGHFDRMKGQVRSDQHPVGQRGAGWRLDHLQRKVGPDWARVAVPWFAVCVTVPTRLSPVWTIVPAMPSPSW